MDFILGPCLHLVFRSVSGNHKPSAETQDSGVHDGNAKHFQLKFRSIFNEFEQRPQTEKLDELVSSRQSYNTH